MSFQYDDFRPKQQKSRFGTMIFDQIDRGVVSVRRFATKFSDNVVSVRCFATILSKFEWFNSDIPPKSIMMSFQYD